MSDSEDVSSIIQADLEFIDDLWDGGLYISYYPARDNSWLISNTTDEGLPTGVEQKTAEGRSLEEAIENAIGGDLRDW